MKVLYVITSADSGGAQRYVLDLAKEFHGEIATGTEKSSLVDQAEDVGIPCYQLYHLKRAINPLDDLPALFDLIRLAIKTKPDIIHLNSSKAGFLGSLVKIFAPHSKIVYTAHGFVFNEPRGAITRSFYTLAERLASLLRDYIITVSETDKQSALDRHIINPEKISVVHNGLAPIKFLNKTSARQYLALPLDKFIIGTIANLYPAKGIDVLIDAVSRMPIESRQNLCVAIIGDGPEAKRLNQLITHYSLQDTIKPLGHRELASHYLNAFDIFTLPSRKEGFPFALLEAMQAGLPIVATDVGGNKEALGDAGLLVPPDRPDIFAQTLTDLSNSPSQMQILSQKALARSGLFTLEKMVAKTEVIYRYLISKP